MLRGAAITISIALVVAATVPSAGAGAQDDADRFEFVALTYNVAGLPEPLSGSEPSTNSPLISPLLDDYDLVLLQEDWDDPIDVGDETLVSYHDAVVADASHAYRSEPAPAPLGADLDRFPTGPPLLADGLNRLSEFPFGPLTREKWRECYGELLITIVEEIFDGAGLEDVGDRLGVDGGAADCGAQKGFSVARTTFPGGLRVDVYNLHAEAGSNPDDQRARADNFVQLAAFIDEFSAGNAVILGGDTNLHTEPDSERVADGEIWSAFQADTGVVDVCNAVECGDDLGRIDKFAFRSGDDVAVVPRSFDVEAATFTRGDGSPLSDHDPVAVRFALADASAGPSTAVDRAAPPTSLPHTGGTEPHVAVALILAAVALALAVLRRPGSALSSRS